MSSRPKFIKDDDDVIVEVKFRGEILRRCRGRESSRPLYMSRNYVMKFCTVQCPAEVETWKNMPRDDRKYFAAIIAYGYNWTVQKRVRTWEDDWSEGFYDMDEHRHHEELAEFYGFSADFKESQYVFCSRRRRWLCVDYAYEW